jgi:8-oxo-dGTP pyrophosphatase MutT (NUDIX family)
MEHQHLAWTEVSRREAYRCRLFAVGERRCRSEDGRENDFTVIDTTDWAIVIPAESRGGGRNFLMVRQWRHGAAELSLEFPGGVIEPGEEPEAAARRELAEETGRTAGRIRRLGAFNPNPAIMSNRVHVFLAEDLSSAGKQELDADEIVDAEWVPAELVLAGMGRAPYIHALMGAALALYLAAGGA